MLANADDIDGDDFLFGDLDGQMDEFVMHNKEAVDRLKSVRLSKGIIDPTRMVKEKS